MSDKTVKSLVCDSCGKELVRETSYPAVYALELKAINVNINTTGLVYGACVYPLIDGTMHFCGKSCLSKWLEAKNDRS